MNVKRKKEKIPSIHKINLFNNIKSLDIIKNVLRGEEILRFSDDTHKRQNQNQQGFHNIEGSGVFNIINNSSTFVYNHGHRAKVIVL